MTCGSCIEKLAKRLMEHHKIDMIRAFELAEKGVERAAARNVQLPLDDPYDYTGPCGSAHGVCYCFPVGTDCSVTGECENFSRRTCSCDACPAPPKAHSHFESTTCTVGTDNTCVCRELTGKCLAAGYCYCRCYGLCYYHCDAGYVWNSATQQCEMPVVPSGGSSHGNFVIVAVLAINAWLRRKRKRKFMVTLK